GGQHNFPLTLSLPPILGGKFLVSPGISYANKWIAEKVRRTWDSTLDTVGETTVTKGFYVDQQVSFNLGINTALYGTFNFKGPKRLAIRHVVRPTLSFSYSPSLSKQHWYKIQVDPSGRISSFPEFERSLYGFYTQEDFAGKIGRASCRARV